ncbi:SDR family NAD(P)-dependent oxidoreductase [Modestobacter sp. VKM Ac-2986]|uniref:SDR family NAD(P)-dependent oxidoreductase n=1 Tax=Modestobacter sp. VKM Ac-2986 TaxID=3004140 RepID=UPI0022ABB02C|nr:SDR family NAD(P)-dependent oxidoreductase [Modestobacter sp. VKM Ac-2986]MCZ2831004.1 SDR family NAD(P)-dependent oxidoreductase [Modestobacter sp. VKM Ac-2986]
MQYAHTTAVVTGASSGIGAEFARTLAHRGADLVLVARRGDLLETLAAEIRSTSGRAVHPIPMDLTADGAGHDLARRVSSMGLTVDTVVNAAGAGRTEPFSTSDAAAVDQQLALNVRAVVDVSHAFLPQLVSSGRGALVNVASLTGYMPVPGMAVYAASKAFVIRFTEALAHETRTSGTTVLAVSPGPTRTGFYADSGTATTGVRFETPAQVVATTLAALERRRPPVSVVSGAGNRLTRRVVGLLPTRVVLQLAESKPAQ